MMLNSLQTWPGANLSDLLFVLTMEKWSKENFLLSVLVLPIYINSA